MPHRPYVAPRVLFCALLGIAPCAAPCAAPGAGTFSLTLAAQQPITVTATLDWKTELIRSVIALDTQAAGIRLPTDRDTALETLAIETPSLLKDTFFSIPINSSQRLGELVLNGTISLRDVNRVIDEGTKTPPWFSADLRRLTTVHTISLAKIGSLFVTHATPWKAKPPLETAETRPYSGILIDARGSLAVHGEYGSEPLAPCLFPRIWTEGMDLVYEKNMVSRAVALDIGIVQYTADDADESLRDRIGTDPLRVIARGVFGQNRTDPIISWADYLKIVSSAENRALLENGKVVILCDRKSLEFRQLGPVKDDDYWFTRKEIADRLTTGEVKKVDFSDSWEGLKLTIYDIKFKADSDVILATERGRLDAIADALKLAGPTARFSVEGHTASVGKPGGELTLSIQRAVAIAKELSTRGIASDRIDTTGFGGTRPLAANDTDEGRAMNRRVEITIHLAPSAKD